MVMQRGHDTLPDDARAYLPRVMSLVRILGWVSHGLAWPRLALMMMHWCIYGTIQQSDSARAKVS